LKKTLDTHSILCVYLGVKKRKKIMILENIKEPISDCCGADINTIDNDGQLLEQTCDDCGDDCLDIYCEFDLDEFLDETEADYLEMKAELAFGI
jgi:hypothetical protein